jgi:hypothetical protein
MSRPLIPTAVWSRSGSWRPRPEVFKANMRAALIAAALIASALPVHAKEDIETAGSFLKRYENGANVYARSYIKGVGDGLSSYNAFVPPPQMIYCPPEKVGMVDGQYVLILKAFVKKQPKLMQSPVDVALMLALVDAFPCKKQ